jgi:thymidylate kinase
VTGIIILDGPDASGKTTLQNHLVNFYGAIPLHLTYNQDVAPRMFDYQTENMLKAIELSKDHLVIVDRHWISEKIYAKVFRGGSPWPLMGNMMDRVWRKHAAIYVICLPLNYDVGINRHRENLDPAHPYVDDKFKELLREYFEFASDFTLRKDTVSYSIDAHGADLNGFCNRLIDKLAVWKYSQYPKALDPSDYSILGHAYDAKYVIMGEQVNKTNEFVWPFYEYRSSSLFLAECLAEIKAPETQIMWTNTRDADGTFNKHLNYLLVEKRLLPIVLGDRAARDVRGWWGIKDAINLPHPQWVKRFNRREEFLASLQRIFYGGTQWK